MIQCEAMKAHYSHPEARECTGRSFGLPFVERLSELSLVTGRAIEWHAHDETEVLCCLRGSLEYEFRGRLGVTVPTGCLLVIPKGLEHRLVGGVDAPCRRLSLFLLEAARQKPAVFSRREYRDLLADILRRRLRPRPFPPDTRNDLTRLADLTAKAALSSRDRVELRTRTAAVLVAFGIDRTVEASRPQTKMIDEALKWLQTHYAEKVTLGQLTAFMGYGPSRFCELFKARTGLPPLEWLIRHRIDRACELLKGDDLSIVEIARRVGFDDASFFGRVFRKRIGLTPSEYRRQHLRR